LFVYSPNLSRNLHLYILLYTATCDIFVTLRLFDRLIYHIFLCWQFFRALIDLLHIKVCIMSKTRAISLKVLRQHGVHASCLGMGDFGKIGSVF
jgi:hypothetical protein